MSIESQDQPPGLGALDEDTTQPPILRFPEDYTLSESWQRAQCEHDKGSAISRSGIERIVWLDNGDPHRVAFIVSGECLRAECSCDGYRYRDFCAHLASLWWRWVRGEVVVPHQQLDRRFTEPPCWLHVDDENHETAEPANIENSGLTAAELDAYLTCELGTTGVREYARKTGRAPGTVGNLLARARCKEGQG
jgi:hypothetical protein